MNQSDAMYRIIDLGDIDVNYGSASDRDRLEHVIGGIFRASVDLGNPESIPTVSWPEGIVTRHLVLIRFLVPVHGIDEVCAAITGLGHQGTGIAEILALRASDKLPNFVWMTRATDPMQRITLACCPGRPLPEFSNGCFRYVSRFIPERTWPPDPSEWWLAQKPLQP